MDVFKSFPHAIVTNVWQIGILVHSTETGKRYEALNFLSVIVDEEGVGELNTSPSAEAQMSGTLLFAKPEELPTLNGAALISDYLIWNTETNLYYRISEFGTGKNQNTGAIEHVELFLEPTGVANE